MTNEIGVACLTVAVILDIGSYYKQIVKTLYTKKSRHVSTSSLMMRIAKDVLVIIALCIYANWAGVFVHVVALLACSTTLYIVAQHKPKGWTLWG